MMSMNHMNPTQNSSFYRQNQAPVSGPPMMPSSTPTSRPRFAFYGPAPYPRPRSSASKPNPSPLAQPDLINPEACSTPIRSSNFNSMGAYHGDRSYVSEDGNSSYATCPETPYGSERSIDSVPGSYLNASYGNSPEYLEATSPVCADPIPQFFRPGMQEGQEPALLSAAGNGNNQNFFRKFPRKRKAPSGQPIKRCELCNLDFASQIPLDMHLRGAKHLKKLKAQETMRSLLSQGLAQKPGGQSTPFHCEVCDLTLNSAVQLQMHYEGTKHKNKLQATAAESQGNKDDASTGEQNGKSDAKPSESASKLFYCETCNVTLNSAEQLQMHCAGTKHKSKVMSQKSEIAAAGESTVEEAEPPSKMARWGCEICNVIVNSQTQLQQHLDSKKHVAKVTGQPLPSKRKKTGGFVKKQEVMANENTTTETISVVPPLSSTFVQSKDES